MLWSFLGTNMYRQQQFGDKRDEPHKTARDMSPKKQVLDTFSKLTKQSKQRIPLLPNRLGPLFLGWRKLGTRIHVVIRKMHSFWAVSCHKGRVPHKNCPKIPDHMNASWMNLQCSLQWNVFFHIPSLHCMVKHEPEIPSKHQTASSSKGLRSFMWFFRNRASCLIKDLKHLPTSY